MIYYKNISFQINELSNHQEILTKMYHGLHKNTVFNIDYKKTDTEDWSNDADNSALHHRNKLHLE